MANPNIILSAQRPRIDRGQNELAGAQIQNQRMQQQVNAMNLYSQDRAIKQDIAKRNALAAAGNDPAALQQAYFAQGDPQAGIAIGKSISDMEAAGRTKLKDEAEILKTYAPMLDDPNSYDAVRQKLVAAMPEAANHIPEAYQPGIGTNLSKQLMTYQEHLAGVGKTEPYPEAVANQKAAISRAGATTVSVDQTQEKEENKAYGKSLVADYDAVRERSDNAAAELQNLRILKNIDVETGALEPAKMFIGKFALALGIPEENLDRMGLDNVYAKEGFVGMAQNLVLTKMQAQKGPQTENDAKRIQQTVASLGNTPQAKEFLLDAAIALREREMQQAEFYDAWKADKGTFDGARSAWNDYKKHTPLMGVNKGSKLPVFYSQWMDAARSANPDADDAALTKLWRTKYGK